jgi:hypothetical protein
MNPIENPELAKLVNAVRQLKDEKREAMKGFKEAIDQAQSAVDQKALEILEGQKSLFDTPVSTAQIVDTARALLKAEAISDEEINDR